MLTLKQTNIFVTALFSATRKTKATRTSTPISSAALMTILTSTLQPRHVYVDHFVVIGPHSVAGTYARHGGRLLAHDLAVQCESYCHGDQPRRGRRVCYLYCQLSLVQIAYCREKCQRYWPDAVGATKQIGKFTVELLSEDASVPQYIKSR